jgi:peptide/nickel transport system permease protein
VSVSVETAARPGAEPAAAVREPGYWEDALHKLRHDGLAVAGGIIVIFLVLAAVLAPVLAPHDPTDQLRDGLNAVGDPIKPGSDFPLGTDQLGRDELSRVLYGARVSLAVGVGANLLAAFIGLLVGGVAGLARPLPQTVIMRAVDVALSFPVLLVAIALLAVVDPSVGPIVLIIGVSFGAYLSRIVFAQVVSLRQRDYVLAARAAGVGAPMILFRHIVPHVIPSVLVFATLGVATAIQLEAALSYVGIGIQPPDASWGNMIADGQDYLVSAPWLVAIPGLAIVLAMVGFSLLGDGLRDALDPTLSPGGRLSGMGVR